MNEMKGFKFNHTAFNTIDITFLNLYKNKCVNNPYIYERKYASRNLIQRLMQSYRHWKAIALPRFLSFWE